MNLSEIAKRVSEETGISSDIIEKAYKSYWLYIRNSVEELPLKMDMNETEFLNLRTNFNIPSLGKLSCTYDRYVGVKKRFQYIRSIRDKNEETDKYKADVQ